MESNPREISSSASIGSRITFFLPVKNEAEILAVQQIIEDVKTIYDGLTHSQIWPSLFEGFWRDPNSAKWIRDPIVLAVIDSPHEIRSEHLNRDIKIIVRYVHGNYLKFDSPQKEVWILSHPLYFLKAIQNL